MHLLIPHVLTLVTISIMTKVNQCKNTFQFITQCKGGISHVFKTAKITVFDRMMMCKSPDVPLQDELLC